MIVRDIYIIINCRIHRSTRCISIRQDSSGRVFSSERAIDRYFGCVDDDSSDVECVQGEILKKTSSEKGIYYNFDWWVQWNYVTVQKSTS